jgi:hypothetical protein
MKILPIKANMTEVNTDRYRILVSYQTPVAYFDRQLNQYHKTSKNWSRTTSRHITQWVNHLSELVEWFVEDQEKLDNLLNEVK